MQAFTKSLWNLPPSPGFEACGWRIAPGRDIAPHQPLAERGDTLLPRLVSGELRVKDAERFLREGG